MYINIYWCKVVEDMKHRLKYDCLRHYHFSKINIILKMNFHLPET